MLLDTNLIDCVWFRGICSRMWMANHSSMLEGRFLHREPPYGVVQVFFSKFRANKIASNEICLILKSWHYKTAMQLKYYLYLYILAGHSLPLKMGELSQISAQK